MLVTVEDIFLAAVEKAPSDRAAYLDAACGADAQLRAQVEALLRSHDEAGSMLEQPLFRGGPTVDEPPAALDGPGTVIGPYKLVERIGEGGMGTVWMAQQTEPVKRLVAVKLIKAGMDSKQVLARFEAERQALALMDHANIARVVDAGTSSAGRPYFVMDLVKGAPITKYCDEHRLTPRQRLELFIPVCQAVQHAHQKGIIHRDLKPSNILIALYDGKPMPKVIDFGVAKAAGQPLTEKTLVTGFGNIIGTLEYMSPEQAEVNQLDIDTRSDIYSLGVLLYELLAGSPPFSRKDLEEAGVLEMLRVIREQEPSKPSTKLSSSDALPTLSANRGTEPAKLTKLVRGELDWIVMKALEKDRNRRYETADGFARDLQRYLADEAVLACPPSLGYRLRKFARRHKGPVFAASIIFLLLVAGVIGTATGLVRARERAEGERRAKEEAQKRLAQIEKGTEVLASVFRDVDPKAEAKEGVSLRVLLGRRLADAAQQLEGEAVGDPLVVARLQHLLATSLEELGHLDQAEGVFLKASRTRERLLGADHLDTADTKHSLAGVCWNQGKYAAAEQLYKDVIQVRSAQLGPDHKDTLSTKNNLALVYMSEGQFDLAEPLLREVLDIRMGRLGADDPKTLQSQHNLAGLYGQRGRWDLAEGLLQEVLRRRISKLGPANFDTIQTQQNLAVAYQKRDDYADAETLLKDALEKSSVELGPRHPMTLNIKGNLAVVYATQQKYALAEVLSKEVLEAEATILPADHPRILQHKRHLGRLYGFMRKFDQSIPLLQATLKAQKTKLRPDHPDTIQTQAALGRVLRDAGRAGEAIALLEEVHRKKPNDPGLVWVGNSLVTAYVEAGKRTEAAALVTRQAQAARKQFPDDAPRLLGALADIAKALVDGRAYADAEPLLRESLALAEQKAADAWQTHHARSLLGGALFGQKKYAEAEPQLVQGYQGMKKFQEDPEHKNPGLSFEQHRTEALERLAQFYEARNRPDEAARWRKELVRGTDKR
jgi:serine/threonine protein kinase/tetratricopeptide (TPR) repeat protein